MLFTKTFLRFENYKYLSCLKKVYSCQLQAMHKIDVHRLIVFFNRKKILKMD